MRGVRARRRRQHRSHARDEGWIRVRPAHPRRDAAELRPDKRSATPDQRFTLAHIQTVCHILAATKTVDYESYRHAFDNNLKALHQAINVCDIISFVEDFSWSDAVWFRNMIKVPLKESKERIADFIKSHYEELVPKPNEQRSRGMVGARVAGPGK